MPNTNGLLNMTSVSVLNGPVGYDPLVRAQDLTQRQKNAPDGSQTLFERIVGLLVTCDLYATRPIADQGSRHTQQAEMPTSQLNVWLGSPALV
jgi:hypothetical protein